MHLQAIPGASQRHCRPASIFTPLIAGGHWLLAVLLSHAPKVRLVLLTLLVLPPLCHAPPLASPSLRLTPAICLLIRCCSACSNAPVLLLPQTLILVASAILPAPYPLKCASTHASSELIISPWAPPVALVIVSDDAAMPSLLWVLSKLLAVRCMMLLVHLHFGGCSPLV